MVSDRTLLDVELNVDYPNRRGALRYVSFCMHRGEILGLVGESGSGKSTIALALLGLLRWKGAHATGHVRFNGRDLLTAKESELCKSRGREIGLILQSPVASLNSALRLGTQLREAWRVHGTGGSVAREVAITTALAQVGLPPDSEFLRRYPSQVSVGQAQRVLLAMAIMHSPALLIADEATSALDTITKTEVVRLMRTLNRERNIAILYISHDLQSVVSLCHRVAILHSGTIVELGETSSVVRRPQHAYTRQLLSCTPWLQSWLDNSGGLPQPALIGVAPAGDSRANAVYSSTSLSGSKVSSRSADVTRETVCHVAAACVLEGGN